MAKEKQQYHGSGYLTMDSDQPIAHITEDGKCQPLYDHLRGVAELAAQFATEFSDREWADI